GLRRRKPCVSRQIGLIRGSPAGLGIGWLRRRRALAETSQCRRLLEPPGEILNKGMHGRMSEAVEPKEIHLMQSSSWRPALQGHAVSGNEGAGAVLAEAAVHEDPFLPGVPEEREKLGHLLVCRRRPSAYRNGHKAQTEGFGFLFFPIAKRSIFTAQIHDGGNSEFFEFRQSARARLRAAIELAADFAGVGNRGEMQLLALAGGKLDGGGSRLRENTRTLRCEQHRQQENAGNQAARTHTTESV